MSYVIHNKMNNTIFDNKQFTSQDEANKYKEDNIPIIRDICDEVYGRIVDYDKLFVIEEVE